MTSSPDNKTNPPKDNKTNPPKDSKEPNAPPCKHIFKEDDGDREENE